VLTPELIATGFGVKATVLRLADGTRTQLIFE
jgi:hypothetical protein